VAHLTAKRCGLHLARVHLEASPSRAVRTPIPLHVADAAPMIVTSGRVVYGSR
jgi:hypothetical protein